MDYRQAGVDIEKADNLIDSVAGLARSTYTRGVIGGVGGFGALFELGRRMKDPVLVSSTDGVGTKILVAREMGKFQGLGYDLVAMCVDDVVCSGATPLFFLDYIAVGKLEQEIYLKLIESIAKACKFSECSLIGGETAELPGMYPDGEFDIAGFCVGAVEKSKMLRPEMVKSGDAVLGLLSSGFHSNGYSLVRKVVRDKGLDYGKDYGFGVLGKALLTPTEIYSPVLVKALQKFDGAIRGIAHITGGGIAGNLSRVIPGQVDATVNKSSWKIPEQIRFIIDQGGISLEEAYKVFNMGIGMALVVDRKKKDAINEFFCSNSYRSHEIGHIEKGTGEVVLV